MFKSHLEMIGRNETPSKKAKFWQSYVRSLKGSDDIRARDAPSIRSNRPYSAYVDLPPRWKSIFDEPATPAERISSHGYRYLPVHRETYGYSPRAIYDHHYSRSTAKDVEEEEETSTIHNEPLSDSNDIDIDFIKKPSKSSSSSGDSVLASGVAYTIEDTDLPEYNDIMRNRQLRRKALEKYLETENPIEYGDYVEKTKKYLRSKRDAFFEQLKEKEIHPTGVQPDEYWDFINMTFPSATADIERAWNEHLKRMADIERRYPSRYGLYLKDKPNVLIPLEYEPEDKPLFSDSSRAPSVPAWFRRSPSRSPSPFDRATSVPIFDRATSLEPDPLRRLRASSLEPLDSAIASKFDVPLNLEPRSMSPTPVKPGRWAPRQSEIAYDSEGLPIYHPALRRGAFGRLLNPSPYLPLSAITRDPWWWDLEDLHPFRAHLPHTHLPPLLRSSYLSPVKRRYLWRAHPMRPFAHTY